MSNEHAREEPSIPQPLQTPTVELARHLARELNGAATVHINYIEGGISVIITPTKPEARAFTWADFSDELVVEVGDHGARWELEVVPEDIAFLEDIARSVIAGRVREILAPGRSDVSIMLADGSVESATGYESLAGCLPLPFWRRWSHTIQYAPYR